MLELTKYYYFLFGVLTIVGGIIGFTRAGSTASLIAGGVSGALILAAGGLLANGQVQSGLIVGLVVSTLLEFRFLPAFLKTKKPMPAGMMAALSMAGAALSILALVLPR